MKTRKENTMELLYVASIVHEDGGSFKVLSVHLYEDDAKQRCRDIVAAAAEGEYEGFLFNVQPAENVDRLFPQAMA